MEAKIDRLLAHHAPLRRGLGLPEADAAGMLASLEAIAPGNPPLRPSRLAAPGRTGQGGAPRPFEGAQAAILDVDHGTYPYVTSSN